ncbi:hypothetical protein ACI2LF_19630 [Kribbella sp. NPDC020789]
MPTRHLLLTTLLTLTACTTPTPPPPKWTPAEQTAITEATTQYKKSRAAYDAALNHPATTTRAGLAAAGMSGVWLDDAIFRADYYRTHKMRRTGTVKILATDPIWVDVAAPNAAVVLKTCLDYSAVAGHDPATVRRLVDAHLLHLPTGWSLTSESENPDTAQRPSPGHPIC